ncbi:MAG: aconitate hydratase AcnA [Nitrospirae bacterium]|nr:MAG: aconitate hydratase AcnA [Nitrospirota bacterium]
MTSNPLNTLQSFNAGDGTEGKFYSLPALEKAGTGKISRLPVSVRIVLESALRNCDGISITEEHIKKIACWDPAAPRTEEIPFVVSRIVLQDFTGVPLLCDLAAMRDAAVAMGKGPDIIEPLVSVDLVIDHSVQIDHYGEPGALKKNMEMEFGRNAERYQFLKWGMNAFDSFKVVPPGIGIVHQVNLEYLARGVHRKDGIYYPDTLVGTDSHTTMINGIGVVGWGVGGIEAEAGMLGQPLYFLMPDVVGVCLTGRLNEGVTATDLVLTVTERLRKEKVVGAFVEFFGDGAAALSVTDRATIANMAPEYGATMGFFPVDAAVTAFLEATGRTEKEVRAFSSYFKAQGIYGIPKPGDIDYTRVVEIDVSKVKRSVAGPKRPQDRIDLSSLKDSFTSVLKTPAKDGGFGKTAQDISARFQTGDGLSVGTGDVIIAAITSCTNTSNPSVLLAAGLLAKNAVEKGLSVDRRIKTSIAPGSRVVSEYLKRTGLLPYLEKLGFYVSAYGCTTCIGNSGPLVNGIEEAIIANDLVCAAVLSGNRNFEARIHPDLKANFLMGPPLVVAFAIAGSVLKDLDKEPLGIGADGQPVFLKDVWPHSSEINALLHQSEDPEMFRRLYGDLTSGHDLWNGVQSANGSRYDWPASTYIAQPPFFKGFRMEAPDISPIKNARALGIFGDSITTDHISPAGAIKEDSPAGIYLKGCGVSKRDFQSYGTRRGNHDVMVRGTFAHVRIKNLMLRMREDGSIAEGGFTLFQPSGERMSIYDAAMRYSAAGTPTLVFGGEEYGTGSSRDWAAKGTRLLGVRAVIARSFERIHRANLVGMGILPLQFAGKDSVQSLGITGDEEFDIPLTYAIVPMQEILLVIKRKSGEKREVELLSRIDTAVEAEYYRNGGILPYVLRGIIAAQRPTE